MKKLMAIILTIALLASCCTAFAGEWVDDEGEKYEQLTVGVTTAFSGNFLADALGSNISDQDVRKMIPEGYELRERKKLTMPNKDATITVYLVPEGVLLIDEDPTALGINNAALGSGEIIE